MDKTHTVARDTSTVSHKIGTAFIGLGYAVFMLASLVGTLLWVALELGILALVAAVLLRLSGLI